MTVPSRPRLLALHAVRVTGMADAHTAAARFGLDRDEVQELLLDDEAAGLVARVPGTVPPAYAVTGAGRREDSRRLAAELDDVGARDVVVAAHRAFLPLNARFLDAVTRWQLHPVPGDPLAANRHDDWTWDARVLDDLGSLGCRLAGVQEQLSGVLRRFDGYADRYARAMQRVERGDRAWVDEPGIDSCHMVWFQLHEDLVSTLGIERDDEV